MNDPGKEAGSWLALALTAHPHFSLAMMRDVQMDLAPSSPIQTFQKTKAEANTRVFQISLQKLEINSEQIWSLNWDKILKIRRRQGCTFFSWTKLQLKAVGPYIPPISTSQAHSWAEEFTDTATPARGGHRPLWIAQCILESPETVTACQLDCQWVEIAPGRR